MSTHYHCTYKYGRREVRLRINALWGCPWPHHVFGFVAMRRDELRGDDLITIGLN